MAKLGRGQRRTRLPSEAASNGDSAFSWEFEQEARDPAVASTRAHQAAPDTPSRAASHKAEQRPHRDEMPRRRDPQVAAAGTGRQARPRAEYIRAQLDRALDRWWVAAELPPLPLLRDALQLLEAGEPLLDSHRTLLLRAALAYDRGVQTALRHQLDDERVALVLAEALVEWEIPLDAARVQQISTDNPAIHALLVTELERSRVLLTGAARYRAQHALEMLAHEVSPPLSTEPPLMATGAEVPPARRTPLRGLLLVLLLATLVSFALWQQRQEQPQGMIAMPAASYALLDATGERADSEVLAAYWIDQFEVTNREYRACVEAGACVWPRSSHSATRTDYFINPSFDAHPVVNVTYEMAEMFCMWQGKRLPTAAEWQAAASVSPTNGQAFRYPWGETFDAQRTNNAASGTGDTVAVGAYRPNGDSPSGAADMAGNVAEWTAAQGGVATIKGGSFADDAAMLMVGSTVIMALDQASPYVGFRCARAHLLTVP